eukprot:NODE_8690_length_1476_cov_6.418829.p1 GENE.NODE_8690_length_1476_cov_6.418829~~NODE_8690_length_1476_cov_6.418829.p1  ORF type:complete len:419 (+),score=83.54 NODE_8690_length_1476_cov_6.418829:100-1356(+)
MSVEECERENADPTYLDGLVSGLPPDLDGQGVAAQLCTLSTFATACNNFSIQFFCGSVVGMLAMGYLGDIIGLRRATIFTNLLVVMGSLVSAVLSWGEPDTMYSIITAGRFMLGTGVGGCYPVSAAKAAKAGAVKVSYTDTVRKVANAFFWQAPGSCMPYLIALLLLQLPHVRDITSWQFRILLGLGALPALVGVCVAVAEPEEEEGMTSREFAAQLRDPRHLSTLVGTAGTWLLYDVALFGTVIFAPTILASIFGAHQSLQDLAIRGLLMGSLAVAGTLCGLQVLRRIGPKTLCTTGLVLCTGLFAAFAVLRHTLPETGQARFMVLCLLFFFMYGGPNIATFVLPIVSFPPEVRSTFHGISAALAKAGAMLGALVFPLVSRRFGTSGVMLMQAVVCAVAVLLSHFFLKSKGHGEPEE